MAIETRPPSRLLRSTITVVAALLLVVAGAAAAVTAGGALDATGPARDASVVDVGHGRPEALPVSCDAVPAACAVGEHAAAYLPYPWATLGYEVVIRDPIDDWHHGRTLASERRIELFVRPDDDPARVAATLAHEVGHALHQPCDEQLLSLWVERRGLPDVTPHHVTPPHDYDSAAEDYAEAFAQYLGFGPSRSTVGRPVDQQWLQTNADLFVPNVCEALG